MTLRLRTAGVLCALGVGAIVGTAQATVTSLTPGVEGASTVEKTASNCWWRNGVRHCRGGSAVRYYERGFPQRFRTGSRRWWDEMDREGRGGRR